MNTDTALLTPTTLDYTPASEAAAGCCSSSPGSTCGGGDNDDSSPKVADGTTRTGDFLATLRSAAPDQRIVFLLDGAELTDPGYHVTEVKAVTYDAMDCGGLADRWQETVIQLWNPNEEPEGGHMAARKFLAIYDQVAAHVPVSDQAEVRFEYGDCCSPAINYHVAGVETQGGQLLVHLRSPAVTCKARDRDSSACGGTDGGCCA